MTQLVEPGMERPEGGADATQSPWAEAPPSSGVSEVMKIKPFGRRLLCKEHPLPGNFGVLLIPEKYRQTFGKFKTGVPHCLLEILDKGPEVKSELEVGDFIIVDGLNTQPVQPCDAEGVKHFRLPLEQAVLVKFLESPVTTDE